MPKKYTSEQFWRLYEKLPEELKDALFSQETGDNTYDICKRNDVGEYLEEVVDLVGQTLVGVLPPEDFQAALEKEAKISKETAKRVAQEINRLIFYPVKSALEQLYKMEVAPAEKAEIKEKKQETSSEDTYRESIE